jgi:hypothetical protein
MPNSICVPLHLLLRLQDMMEVKSKMLMTFVASLWMAKITHSNHH